MLSRRTIQKGSTITKNGVESVADAAPRLPQRDPISPGETVRDPTDDGSTSLPIAFSNKSVVLDSSRTTLWLRRADQLLLGFLLISLLVLLVAFRWKLSGGGRTEIEIVSQQPREYFYAIEVNNASWVEWAQLDGIGEKLAKRIVEDRQKHGPFESIDDIRRVRGLGSKLIDKLRPFLKCDNDSVRPTDETPGSATELR